MARDSGLGAVRVVEGGGGAGPLWRARRCFAAALLDGHAGRRRGSGADSAAVRLADAAAVSIRRRSGGLRGVDGGRCLNE